MPFLIQYLCTTQTTPWGIITSIFVHRDLNHFMSNMISLLLYTALFIFTNMNLSEHEKKRRSVFFLRVVFLSATLANVGWIIVAPNIFSAGSSGAVYASLGIMFGFSLINSIPSSFQKEVLRQHLHDFCRISNISVFVVFFFWIMLNIEIFLSIAPNVNVFAHGMGFNISLFLVLVNFLLLPKKHNELEVIPNGYTRDQILEHIRNKGGITHYSTRDILNKIEKYVQANGSTIGLSFAGKNLAGIDLSQENIIKEFESQGYSEKSPPLWYSGDLKRELLRKRADIIASARNPDASEVISKKAIQLEGVNFSNSILVCANFEGADLDRANFEGARLHYANLRKTRLFDANFIDARLINVDLTGAALQNANFNWATLRGAVINKCLLYHVKLEKTEMEKKQVEETWEEIKAKEEKKANRDSHRHYADAAIAYNRLKNNFVSIGKHNDAGWAFIKEMRMERNTYKKLSLRWWLNLFMDLSCGYGEHPWKVIILALSIVLSFGIIYWLLGGIKPEFEDTTIIWSDYFIFSLRCFVTLAFPDLNPANTSVKILSSMESGIGISFFALLMYSLGRRLTGH